MDKHTQEVKARTEEVGRFLGNLQNIVAHEVQKDMQYLSVCTVDDYLIELRDGHMSEEEATLFDDDNPDAWRALEELASAYLKALRFVTPDPEN